MMMMMMMIKIVVLTGVEDAFCASPKVMTVSIHKHSPGFFPGLYKDIKMID
jgi:acetoin utilization deacetylase AcuC-like enzyme